MTAPGRMLRRKTAKPASGQPYAGLECPRCGAVIQGTRWRAGEKIEFSEREGMRQHETVVHPEARP